MNSDELREALKRLRLSAGFNTQKALGVELGRSSVWVGKIENGNLQIKIDDISRWAEACGRRVELRFVTPEREPQERSTPDLLMEMWPMMDEHDREAFNALIRVFAMRLLEGRQAG